MFSLQLAMERALIEGEHELVFKDILKASESDQTKLRELYRNLQMLIESMLTQKTSVSHPFLVHSFSFDAMFSASKSNSFDTTSSRTIAK